MTCWPMMRSRTGTLGAVLGVLLLMPPGALALRSVSRGHSPVPNRGWPTGVEEVANLQSRIAYTEGPAGGEYAFAYRCDDTAGFKEALQLFGAIRVPRSVRPSMAPAGRADVIDSKPLLLVVHDAGDALGESAAWSFLDERVDWTFSIWVPASFYRAFCSSHGGFRADHPYFRQPVPPPRIDVYVGGDSPIVWEDVTVPDTVRVMDSRRVAAPVDVAGGGVLLTRVFDMATHQVIAGADVVLQNRMKQGETQETARVTTDADGAVSIRNIPKGYYAIHVEADGYAGRIVGPYDNRGAHAYREIDVLLAESASLRGRVVDPHGGPVPGVSVGPRSALGLNGLGYRCSREPLAVSDKDGTFELAPLPRGSTSIRCTGAIVHQVSPPWELFRVGVRPWEKSEEAVIVVEGTGIVTGKVVDETGAPPQRPFVVDIAPPGGPAVGRWGGSMQADEGGVFIFGSVPPGEYEITARPNRGREDEATPATTLTVRPGQTVHVEIVSRFARRAR